MAVQFIHYDTEVIIVRERECLVYVNVFYLRSWEPVQTLLTVSSLSPLAALCPLKSG